MSSREDDIRRVYEENFFRSPPVVRPDDEMCLHVDKCVPDDRAAQILDAGCGTGRWSRYLVARGYTNVHAVDLFENLEIPGAAYQTASLSALPFAGETFDFCLSLSVIHYLDPPRIALEEFFRVLRPGALLLLTVHTKFSVFTAVRVLKRAIGAKSADHLKHCRFQSVAVYERYLEQSGFRVLRRDGLRTAWSSLRRRIRPWLGVAGLVDPAGVSQSRMTQGALMCRYKAWFAYHAIIVAQKPQEQSGEPRQ